MQFKVIYSKGTGHVKPMFFKTAEAMLPPAQGVKPEASAWRKRVWISGTARIESLK
jgi:hypothetical protein